MDIIFEYLTLILWVAPLYFFAMSFLHFRQKIKPSIFYGYSAKGQLMLGVAFTFGVSSFLFQKSGVPLVLLLCYGAILIWAITVEKREKTKLESTVS
jgi:hypothetical protein